MRDAIGGCGGGGGRVSESENARDDILDKQLVICYTILMFLCF